jgi:hypothetical protein
MDPMKQTVALDFDGVLHGYSKGWQDGSIYDPPVEGAQAFVSQLLDAGVNVVIYSTRASSFSNRVAMMGWLRRYGFPDNDWSENITDSKPMCRVMLDDRAVTFDGEFPPIETLTKFEPWMKRSG